jgi:hypothetical protein
MCDQNLGKQVAVMYEEKSSWALSPLINERYNVWNAIRVVPSKNCNTDGM